MDTNREGVILGLLRDMKDRIAEEAEYDYEAREIVHKVDRILAGKMPNKNNSQIERILNEAL
jgi:hypothetical protein